MEGLARREETHWKEAARRDSQARKKGQAKDHSLPAPQEYLDFVEAFLNSPRAFLEEGDYILFGDQLYRAPILPGNFKGLKVLRPGLHLGTLKKNRIEPAQALAMALRPGEAALSICLDPQGEEIRRYLKGEALTADLRRFPQLTGKKGWVLVCAGTCSAGWAKLAGNVLKNHYPKGLRREL